jgi:hypothetical protein
MAMNEEEVNQGVELTQNLGTAPTKRARGEIDRRMFTNIDDDDIDWLIFCRLGKELGNRALAIIYDEFLHDKIGVGALGMRYAIKGESVRKGIGANFEEEAPQHNRFSRAIRTLVNPSWEEEERKRLNLE